MNVVAAGAFARVEDGLVNRFDSDKAHDPRKAQRKNMDHPWHNHGDHRHHRSQLDGRDNVNDAPLK